MTMFLLEAQLYVILTSPMNTKNFFKFLNPDVNSDDLTMFDTWLTDFYITQNLWIKNPQS